LKATETKLNHKFVLDSDDVQLEADIKTESDPICSSAGCWKSKHQKEAEEKIIQYPDPEEQGLEHDVKVSINNEANASKKLSHNWDILKAE